MTPTTLFAHPAERVALVTGAASGIGEATVLRLAEAGIGALVAVDRDAERLARLAATVRGTQLLTRAQDVADEAAWRATMAATQDRFGRLDLLVANAGVAEGGPIEGFAIDAWRRVMSVNLDGVFLTLKHGMAAIRAGGRGGAVVVVASVAGVKADAGAGAYGASKAAALHLARVAAKEGVSARIRVNTLLPGGVTTPMWSGTAMFTELVQKTGSDAAAFAELGRTGAPLGRFASAAEIAGQVVFLLSDASATTTGAALIVDGGYSL